MQPIPANDIIGRAREIQMHVARNSLDKAINCLLDYVREFSHENRTLYFEAIVISNNLSEIQSELSIGRLALDEASVKKNRILYQMLSLVDKVQEQPQTPYV